MSAFSFINLKFFTMKTILKTLVILLLIGIPFSSCDSVESLADIKFTTTLSGDMNVNIPPSGSLYSAKLADISFSGQATIDPTSDTQINKYLDKLKSFDVQEITGTFSKVSKNVMLKTGNITISQGSKKATWQFDKITVSNGTKIILDSGEGQWTTVNQILKGKSIFTAKISGTVDDDDVSFTVTISITTKVVANPLN